MDHSSRRTPIEELLIHAEDEVDSAGVGAYLRGKVVLVTGAGGSIGSELCRQICRCRPGHLLLLGRGEHSIYQIERELKAAHGGQSIESAIADVGHPGKMDYVFRNCRPEVVFHTAAYKHLSFLERNPEEGVLNNVFGTRNIACMARRHQTEKFVAISTDKAVRATSVLGATKRLAELLLQGLNGEGRTEFVNVRFGNVLRSRGSVVPLFEQQIAAGGPVTVSHPEVRRYFMSLREAVQLVLHSGAIGRRGDLCILDMGEPVRILELAQTLIRLQGREADEQIEIVFTGLEPGEKLAEQMLSEAEASRLRKAGKIMICASEAGNGGPSEEDMEALRRAAEACRREEVRRRLQKMVPDYRPCRAGRAGMGGVLRRGEGETGG